MDSKTIDSCLKIFDSNTPKFFEPHERKDFQEFLQKRNSRFLVILRQDQIVACGGYTLRNVADEARLRWGMVRSDFHKQGLGEALLVERLNKILEEKKIQKVIVSTTHLNTDFYTRYGFKERSSEKNYFREGLHLHNLELAIEQIENLKIGGLLSGFEVTWVTGVKE